MPKTPVEANVEKLMKGSNKEKGNYSVLRDVLYLFVKIAVIVLVFFLLFTFVYGMERYSDASMRPAIHDGDLVVFYQLDHTYVAGDVVMLMFDGERQARRVVAVAGDVVDITADGGLKVNGAIQQEPDIYEETNGYQEGIRFPVTVGEGRVFLLADSRENSTDSRIYGAVDVDDTMGKVITILRRRNI